MSTGVGAVTSFEAATWRKSSYSSEANACVEIVSIADRVAIRDTKAQRADMIVLKRTAWVSLTAWCRL